MSKGEKLVISLLFQLAAGIYLAIYDHTLHTFGLLHYYALIGYIILDAVFLSLIIIAFSPKLGHLVGFVSALGVIAMVADAFLGLPASNYSTTPIYGMEYLFGFGIAGTGSAFGTSMAFSTLLIASAVTALLVAKSR